MIDPNAPVKKSGVGRGILIGALVAAGLCLVLCVVSFFLLKDKFGDMFKLDPQQTRELATQIADYELPSGYKELFGMTTMGLITATFTNADNSVTLMLFQTEQGSLPDVGTYLNSSGNNSSGTEKITWEQVGTRAATIRGEKTNLTVYAGTTDTGKKSNAWTGKFTGKGGKAMLLILGPAAGWNEAELDAFVKSLR